MQEKHVTAAGRTMSWKLRSGAGDAESHRDGRHVSVAGSAARSFMFNIVMNYLSEDDEVRVVTETTTAAQPKLERVLSGADIQMFHRRSGTCCI